MPEPQVANYVQLTHDGLQKWLIGTDGSRLFLTVVDSGVEDTAAVPITGGEPTRIALPGPDMFPVDISLGWCIVPAGGWNRVSRDRSDVELTGARGFSKAAG